MNEYLPIIASLFTITLGVLGLFFPYKIANMVGIKEKSEIGKSEIRATYGGLFLGIGISCLIISSQDAFVVAGLAWSSAAVARLCSILIERYYQSKNLIGLAVEAGIGILFLASLL